MYDATDDEVGKVKQTGESQKSLMISFLPKSLLELVVVRVAWRVPWDQLSEMDRESIFLTNDSTTTVCMHCS